MADLQKIIRDAFPKKSVALIGDLVADQFLRGTIERVSREAPVFILRHDETETRPGAAANAAANVASLGGRPMLVGVIGSDDTGRLLADNLTRSGVDGQLILTDEHAGTTTKVRVLAGQHYAPRQQVIRIDYAGNKELSRETRERMIANALAACETADVVIISDYGYGVGSPEIAEAAIEASRKRGVPVVVDSRARLDQFGGATSATPNQEEVEKLLGESFSDNDCERLRERLGLRSLLVTRGNKGVLLFEEGASPRSIGAVGSAEPVDVTGAGDTVIAAFALGLASGLTHSDAAALANHAGGIVVMKRGTATASAAELIASLSSNNRSEATVP
jgi:rfaE bifunctional protein kinase chain/domain